MAARQIMETPITAVSTYANYHVKYHFTGVSSHAGTSRKYDYFQKVQSKVQSNHYQALFL